MAIRQRAVRGSSAREHVVQFFDTAESRGKTIARFVTDSLAADYIVPTHGPTSRFALAEAQWT